MGRMEKEKEEAERKMRALEDGWREDVAKVKKSLQMQLFSAEKERQEVGGLSSVAVL